MKRRNALQWISKGTILISIPSILVSKNQLIPNEKRQEIIWAPLLSFVGRFCFAVGTTVVADLVTDYIKRNFLNNPTTCKYPAPIYLNTNNVINENSRMNREGYNNLTNSTVYQNNDMVIYPATKVDNYIPDRLDVQVPFFNPKTSNTINSMKGPDLIGIGLVTEQTAKYRGEKFARQYLQPAKGIQSSNGSFQYGLSNSLNYISLNGTEVEIDYKTKINRSNEGIIKVIASEGFNRLIDQEYKILFA